MIVRCGRCRAELEVAGPGEFLCPACGTRNVVRAARSADAYDLGGLTVPGGAPRSAPAPAPDPPGVRWVSCPACGYRFAMGDVDRVTCPNCRAALDRSPDGALRASAG
jgi:DNA-directed RNA polymerase subunit RPC12/RpoP